MKPFDEALFDFANRLRAEGGFDKCEGGEDAAAIVLTDLVTEVLVEAGLDYYPYPVVSSKANASVGACFMAACLTGISVPLGRFGVDLDIADVFSRAGFAVFKAYEEQDRVEIVSAGGNTFKNLVAEASSHENLREWVEQVQFSTAGYVLTQDKVWITRLAKLYETLAAARE